MAEKIESFEFEPGKEELHSSRFTAKNSKNNAQVSETLNGGTTKTETKSRFPLLVTAMAAAPPPPLEDKKPTIEPKQEERNDVLDWSPEDDGIKIRIPSSSTDDESETREIIDSYINGVLYGPSGKKRLPVFAELCPDFDR